MKKKKLHHLAGGMPELKERFDEYAWAYTEAQAKFIVHQRLADHHERTKLYLEYQEVEVIEPATAVLRQKKKAA